METQAEQLLLFSTKRHVTMLFKDFLVILQDIRSRHADSMGKLIDSLPESEKAKVVLADHFSSEEVERLRKRILTNGNDCYRAIEDQIKNLKVEFK
jgi:hypothetical protein